jgi:hypothetical protein
MMEETRALWRLSTYDKGKMYDTLQQMLRNDTVNQQTKFEVMFHVKAIEELLIGEVSDSLPSENLERISQNHMNLIQEALSQEEEDKEV